MSISYTPACGAANHTIVFGSLEGLAAYDYTGQVCGIGTHGEFGGFVLGDGSYYFLVVGNDGVSAEGSYGTDSALGERPEDIGDPPCAFVQDLTLRCDKDWSVADILITPAIYGEFPNPDNPDNPESPHFDLAAVAGGHWPPITRTTQSFVEKEGACSYGYCRVRRVDSAKPARATDRWEWAPAQGPSGNGQPRRIEAELWCLWAAS